MSYFEKMSLQAGMNFRGVPGTSIFLMSTRKGAPYQDRIEGEGKTLIYEGHDVPRHAGVVDPKALDQVLETKTGTRTQNGKFYDAAQRYKSEGAEAGLIRVCQKLRPGIWVFNGIFR